MTNLRAFTLAFLIGLALAFIPKAFSTVSSTTSQTTTAVGDGSTTVCYTIGFTFQDNDNLKVYRVQNSVSTLLLEGSGAAKYTVTGGDPGTCILPGTVLTASQHLLIKRVMPITQTVNYDENQAFPADDHEEQMDKNTYIDQQLQSQIDGLATSTLGGTVTDVTLTMPSMFDILGASTITTSGTFGVTLASQGQSTFLAAPTSAAGVPTFRTITAGDLPSTALPLSGVGASTYANTTLTVTNQGIITAASHGERVERATIAADGTVTAKSSWGITNVHSATGVNTITIPVATFNVAPTCTCSAVSSSNQTCSFQSATTANTIVTLTQDAGGGTDTDDITYVICVGSRQ